MSDALPRRGLGTSRQPEVTGKTFGFNVIKDWMNKKNQIGCLFRNFSSDTGIVIYAHFYV